MKILWFTNTPSLYKKNTKGYNGGGWIESLEQIIAQQKDIELAVSFFHSDDCFKSKQGRSTYYPISHYNSILKKIKHNLFYNKYDKAEINAFMEVVEDFKPDVIHIFGSEQSFGLITKQTKIPVIIHIQGILNPYQNAYYAPGYSKLDIVKSNLLKPLYLILKLRGLQIFNHNTKREVTILKNCNFFMGRTEWDKNVSLLFAPQANYFYCSEVLRDIFYTSVPWKVKNRDKFVLVSTISKTSYKGFDLVLKTAQLLKQLASDFNFEWRIFGVNEYKEWEKKLGIKCNEVNIHLRGIANSETLVQNIQDADLFMHPSYIDNSPNSVCEAQILGIPVISTNVGGISSLIENNKTGVLIPANDPYTLASKIITFKNNPEIASKIGNKARETALLRHNKETIKTDLLNIYKDIQNAINNN